MKHNYDRIDFLKKFNTLIPNGKGVEIGVFKGGFSKEILNAWNGKLYMIDVWRGLGNEYEDMSNHNNHTEAYFETMKNISGFEERGIMIRSLSKDCVDLFENESLDFVYIDANHAYDFIKEDMNLWFPKLKKGGIFSGHDYFPDTRIWRGKACGVYQAVNEFAEKMGTQVHHVTDVRREGGPGVACSSFFIVK